ncbi:hypothetical protein CIB84_006654, partial [Bambusicola thoracicus]
LSSKKPYTYVGNVCAPLKFLFLFTNSCRNTANTKSAWNTTRHTRVEATAVSISHENIEFHCIADSFQEYDQMQQKQQYTNQLAKETDKYIKEFGSLPATSEQRQKKIQKDRLVGEFTTALTNFQRLQRQAAEKEKDFVARVRASSRLSGGAPEDSYKEGTLVSWDR